MCIGKRSPPLAPNLHLSMLMGEFRALEAVNHSRPRLAARCLYYRGLSDLAANA